MTHDQLMKRIRRELAAAGSQTALARQWGVSIPYLNDVLHGRRDPGVSILTALGLERAPVSYRKKAASG